MPGALLTGVRIRSGTKLGLIGLGLFAAASILQFFYNSRAAVYAIAGSIVLQWTAIVLFVIAGIRASRLWLLLPLVIAAGLALLLLSH